MPDPGGCAKLIVVYISRRQSIILAVGTLVLFFVGGILFMQRERRIITQPVEATGPVGATPAADTAASDTAASDTAASETPAPAVTAGLSAGTPTADSAFTLNNFQRSEIKDGRTVWEVSAVQGQYFPAEDLARLKEANLLVHRKSGELVRLTAAEAVLHLKGPTLERAVVRGQVRIVQNDDTTLTTEEATWDRGANLVTAPGPVRVESRRLSLRGSGLRADLEREIFSLTSNVETVLKPERRPGGVTERR